MTMKIINKGSFRILAKWIENLFSQDAQLIGAEVGVLRGELSQYLLNKFPSLFLYMIDFYYPEFTNGSWEQEKINVALCEAHTRTVEYWERKFLMISDSSIAAQHIPDASLDFVYIDAGHSAADVWKDLNNWYPKVKPGGLVSGHDYNGVGDRKGKFQVKPTVDKFAKQHNYEITTGGHLVWLFVKRENEDDRLRTDTVSESTINWC